MPAVSNQGQLGQSGSRACLRPRGNGTIETKKKLPRFARKPRLRRVRLRRVRLRRQLLRPWSGRRLTAPCFWGLLVGPRGCKRGACCKQPRETGPIWISGTGSPRLRDQEVTAPLRQESDSCGSRRKPSSGLFKILASLFSVIGHSEATWSAFKYGRGASDGFGYSDSEAGSSRCHH